MKQIIDNLKQIWNYPQEAKLNLRRFEKIRKYLMDLNKKVLEAEKYAEGSFDASYRARTDVTDIDTELRQHLTDVLQDVDKRLKKLESK